MCDASVAPHPVKQRHDISSRGTQSRGRLGIRHLLNPALDLGHQKEALRLIAQLAREQIHEGVDLPRRRLELVTIEPITMEVHERITRLRNTRTQCLQLSQNFRRRRTG
jgi:hypothetical protein